MRRALLLALLIVTTLPSGASAFVIGGRAWPGHVVPYFDASHNHAAIRIAVHNWNTSGVRVRFVKVSRARARIVIRTALAGCQGYAQIGSYPGVGVRLGTCADTWSLAQVATHELGHVLGLAHETHRCALMNLVFFNGAPQRCKPPPRFDYRCRAIEADDLRGAARLYGGRVHVRKSPDCPLFAPPGAVTNLSARWVTGKGIYVSAKLPAAPKPAVPVAFTDSPFPTLLAVPGACPADLAPLWARPAGDVSTDTEVSKGAEALISGSDAYDRVQAGVWCIAMRVVDGQLRAGKAARAEVTVPPAPQPTATAPQPTPTPYPTAGPPLQPDFTYSDFISQGDTDSFQDVTGPRSRIASEEWDFGDPDSGSDNQASGENVSHLYASPGDYTVTLTVTDTDGNPTFVQHSLYVQGVGTPTPTPTP